MASICSIHQTPEPGCDLCATDWNPGEGHQVDRFDKVNEAADVIGAAIGRHYGGDIDVYAVLGGLSTIAADIISKCPADARDELLAAWDESPSWVRQSLLQKSGKN